MVIFKKYLARVENEPVSIERENIFEKLSQMTRTSILTKMCMGQMIL